MRKNNWNIFLKVIIAVASAIAGVIGGQGLLWRSADHFGWNNKCRCLFERMDSGILLYGLRNR